MYTGHIYDLRGTTQGSSLGCLDVVCVIAELWTLAVATLFAEGKIF